MMRRWLLLEPLEGGADAALLVLRLITGGFLVTAMWPNVSDPATMREVVGYFAANGFAYPEYFGPLSAWAQLLIGVALIAGIWVRLAGLLLAFNFMVGLVMVHIDDSLREQWPALALLVTGLLLSGTGGGRFGLDAFIRWDPFRIRPVERFEKDLGLLLLRLATGIFLIHGVWDNVTSAERMTEFAGFLSASGFAAPELMAPLSVYAQLLIGAALLPGLLTRWMGLLLAFNFVVAEAMVHWGQSYREQWPALALIAFGLIFATIGAGRWSADRALVGRRAS